MKIHSISTSQYPTFDRGYQIHIETGSKTNPYAMLNISETQYNDLQQLFASRDAIAEVKDENYSTVVLVR